MRKTFGWAAVAALGLAQVAFGSTWQLDPDHSTAEFSVKHMMVSNVKGAFSNVQGTVTLDEKSPAKTTVKATIPADTVDTRQAKRDAHLKSPDFFDVAKYPTITFESTGVKPGAKGHYAVSGKLTMHGVTRPVVLDAELSQPAKDPWGNTRRGFHATTKVNREDYGLTWNKALEAGGVMVGKDVQISLDGELIEKK
jgi:polyisoprenoid-binding protein YceI